MKFTVLSHAGLLVESGGVSALADPWLIGSCYWRSWFNFPEPEPELIEGLAPDWIYLTHLHWDHFHGPSLRLFPRDTPVIVPHTSTPRMVDDLNYIGFHDVREVPHGESLQLGPGFTIHSFQFNPIHPDSVAVFQDADATVMDVNDCKCFGLTLRQIMKRFPKVDFVLRSHSNAMAFPYCIEGWEEQFNHIRTQDNYRDEFGAFVRTVGARYAVPFASNHCFLHPQTREFNTTVTRPNAVAEHLAATKSHENDPECVIMPPGSSWHGEAGNERFDIRPFDYGSPMAYVEELSQRHAHKLAAQLRREDRAIGDFANFERYFMSFMAALGWPLRRLLWPVCFEVHEASRKRFWRVDFRAKRVDEQPVANDDDLTIAIAALVMNDCCAKKMFSNWTPSKRLRIRLGRRTLNQLHLFINLLDFYECDNLPLRRFFSRRSLAVWRRRWREPLDLLRAVVVMGLFRRPFKSLYRVPPVTRR